MPVTAEALLHKLLEAQGEIHPGWNNEYLEAWWVRQIAEAALEQMRIETQSLSLVAKMRFTQMVEKDVKELEATIRTIARLSNYSSTTELSQVLSGALLSEHRTLQQNFWRIIAEMMELYVAADEVFSHDLRNEGSLLWCKKALAQYNGLPFI